MDWKEALKDNRLKAVLFWTDWCEDCDYVKKEFEKVYNPYFAFVEVNADERPDLALRYSPQIFPSISIISKGNVIGGIYGKVNAETIGEVLLKVLDLSLGGGVLVKPNSPKVERTKYTIDEAIRTIRRNCLAMFDIYYGGFEKEPKYFLPNVLIFLIELGDNYSLEVAKYTAEAAIYYLWDEGFYPYAKSYDWKIHPNFKLLDVNAEAIIALLKLYEKTKDDYFLEYAIETGNWILKNKIDGLYPIAIVDRKIIKKYYIDVNSKIGEALIYLFKFTQDKKFLDEAISLKNKLLSYSSWSHLLNSNVPLFFLDLAYLLRFLSYFKEGDIVINLAKSKYSSEDGTFYDVDFSIANEEMIGRYKIMFENAVFAQGLLNLGYFEEARKIADYFLDSFYQFNYVDQAEYGRLLVRLNEAS